MGDDLSKKEKSDLRSTQFAASLKTAKMKIEKYDPSMRRPIFTNGPTMTVDKFWKTLIEKLGKDAVNFPEVFRASYDLIEAEKMIEQYAAENSLIKQANRAEIEVPADMVGLQLNFNMTAQGREPKFFLTDENELISRISGEAYLLTYQLSPPEAVPHARSVIPEYMPREAAGISIRIKKSRKETIFNSYMPPPWAGYSGWDKLPAKPPLLVKKLIKHLFPDPVERTYLLDWLYCSMTSRAHVYLILCAPPGTGKNRLKLLFRALHGHDNTTDGKRSTLTERFNSQLSISTLNWFDELRYDPAMENIMKEIQNDSIAIERKGIDATRGTRIHASIVISNNKPKDNYIDFDSRKFAPLVLTDKRLEESMESEEIRNLTDMIENQDSASFNLPFIAQTAKWLLRRGRRGDWPNLEYRGPMFWSLAHTSMTQWQKMAITALIAPDARDTQCGWDASKKGFIWSEIQKRILRKGDYRHLKFPDHSTTRSFLDIFRDSEGRKAFSTELFPAPNILGDFWVRPLFKKTEIVTESSIAEQREKAHAKIQKEKLDL